MPDGRSQFTLIHPQWMTLNGGFQSAGLAAYPDYYNMLVLPSRFLVPEPFSPSFKTGTTLPPSADPSFMAGDGSRLFYDFEMTHRDCKSLKSRPLPLETVHLGEHVVLFL